MRGRGEGGEAEGEVRKGGCCEWGEGGVGGVMGGVVGDGRGEGR